MNGIYVVTPRKSLGWDAYDKIVVVASSDDEAKHIHPCGPNGWRDGEMWSESPDDVTSVRVGMAHNDQEVGTILCASFVS